MLDNITKKRIDDARDILVGKLPDPKSQVEQITVALIYKFMNDMDSEFEELGGDAEFFTGEYKEYRWANIVSKEKSGFEKLNLYAEALEKLSLNNNIPTLFRNIFKNVFLPYRDPETFNLFVKEINGFSYEHSEDLGDAFEYLLSIMSSQGDAGQFRTPRHIIDFIVDIVQPKKNESILDPACGTAGFLISAYKYIIKDNEEKGLTPDEKAKLTENIVGYDISPDMVRLSLVNLYLHLFSNPQIYEYDTLTNDTRWNDTFDVILANPPFMTPKGGIRPHDKFSISAKRSEVLFVDYIMEHLNINGRAGVIVPEGIVFQTSNAYKNLRKNLVENNFIWGVVSLPSGVFNPYSGVKTSILLMDKEIAKKTDNILFVKIDNDGYNLGAQRRQVIGSDMPKVAELLKGYKQKICIGESYELNEYEEEFAVLTEKNKIKEQEYILVGERYRKKELYHNIKYSMVELGHIFKLSSGKFLPKKDMIDGEVKVYGGNGVTGSHNEYFLDKPTLIIGRVGEYCGAVHITEKKAWVTDNALMATEYLVDVSQKYLFYALNYINLNQYAKVGGQPSISQSSINGVKIPLPPLLIQEEIVAVIEGYKKIIDGAKQVIENYVPTIKIDPEWEMVKMNDVCEKITDGTHQTPTYAEEGFIFLSSKNVTSGKIDWDNVKYIPKELHEQLYKRLTPIKNDILLAKNGTTGIAAIVDRDCVFDIYVSLALLRPLEIILPQYLLSMINSAFVKKQFNSRLNGIGVPNLHLKEIKEVEIPLPPIEIQQKIVDQINEETSIIEQNKRLIEIFEHKIKDKIAEIWSE